MKYSPLIFLCLIACSDNSEQVPIDFSQQEATVVELRAEDGYEINPTTGQPIPPLVNSLGDTLITGVPFKGNGYRINPDSLEPPEVVQFAGLDALPRHKAASAGIPLIGEPLKLAIDERNLTTIAVTQSYKSDSSAFLVSTIGDTIPTRVPVAVKPKVLPMPSPTLVKSAAPKFRDNARLDIRCYDVQQGPPNSTVNCITKDAQGNLWYGTNGGGFGVFNGTYFRNYSLGLGLFGDMVKSIMFDRKGNLWLATYGEGVFRFDGKELIQIGVEQGLSNGKTWVVYEDSKSNIWIGGRGQGVLMFDGENLTHYSSNDGLSGNYINSIFEDSRGNMWFGTVLNGVTKFDGKRFVQFSTSDGLPHEQVYSIIEDQAGVIWFGTYAGLCSYDGSELSIYNTENGLSGNKVRGLCLEENGDIWAATIGGGVSVFNGRSFYHIAQKDGLSLNSIVAVMPGEQSNIWIATASAGLNKLQEFSFQHYSTNEGLSDNLIQTIAERRNGEIWFGSEQHGINIYDGINFRYLTTKEGLCGNNISSIFEDSRGDIWIGTRGNGVSRIVGNTITNYNTIPDLVDDYIFAIAEDKNGHIWLARYAFGVSRFDGEAFYHYNEENALSNNTTWSIVPDREGNLWFGHDGSGVAKYDGEHFTYYTEREGFPASVVWDIIEAVNGDMWFATGGDGVVRFDGERFIHYNHSVSGLSNDLVFTITEDKDQRIWLSTEHGISCIIPSELQLDTVDLVNGTGRISAQVQSYVGLDGLRCEDFFLGANILDRNNKLWWGGSKNLTTLEVDRKMERIPQPSIDLERVVISDTIYNLDLLSSEQQEGFSYTEITPWKNIPVGLELAYERNHITFYFSSSYKSAVHNVKYSHRLLGQSANWSPLSDQALVDHRNISPGKHVLQVRAMGQDRRWGEVMEYEFVILNPWYLTAQAYVVYAILLVLAVWAVVALRTRNLTKRKFELKQEVSIATKDLKLQKEEAEKQKNVIESAHNKVQESIRYARRIQQATLAHPQMLQKLIPEGFVFYRPKDVVAGDFYWMEIKGDTVYFAVADCTGHGVPGALVSVMCMNGLNRSLFENDLHEPGEILDKTREYIVQSFERSSEDVKDGMDIALCSLRGNELKYAGANIPLCLVEDGVIMVLRPDKQPIGKFHAPTPFNTHVINVSSGTRVYMSSDGFTDQFGGEKGKKFKRGPFHELLRQIQQYPMKTQELRIAECFDTWIGEYKQVDDVCVMGIQVPKPDSSRLDISEAQEIRDMFDFSQSNS